MLIEALKRIRIRKGADAFELPRRTCVLSMNYILNNLSIETLLTTTLKYLNNFFEILKKNSKLKTNSQIINDDKIKGKFCFQNFYNEKDTK